VRAGDLRHGLAARKPAFDLAVADDEAAELLETLRRGCVAVHVMNHEDLGKRMLAEQGCNQGVRERSPTTMLHHAHEAPA
jgi:hypothetical protein